MPVILDVGANSGEFGLELAKRNGEARVYLVEPQADMAAGLRESVAALGLPHVVVHEIAIAEEEGEATLGVSHRGDRGVSSLLPFDAGHLARDPYWSLREDLVFESEEAVRCVTLDNFLKEIGRPRVDFIKIDVQGLDLAVLRSAGPALDAIEAGMLEVASVPSVALYAGEGQDARTALNFLDDRGFAVVALKPNDPACNEMNVFFTRTPGAWEETARRLGLTGLEAFDGKHFWHRPSASPTADAGAGPEAVEALRHATGENERLEAEVARLGGRVAELEERVRVQDGRIAELEGCVTAAAAASTENERLQTEIARLGGRVAELEERVGVQDGRITELEGFIDAGASPGPERADDSAAPHAHHPKERPMLNIVIPMAGAGSRFAKAGYKDPKPLIPVDGVPMIRLVIENLRPSRAHRFVFICQEAHVAAYGLREKLTAWAPGCEIVGLNGLTEGAACSVLTAREFIDNGDELMIANSDQYVDVAIDDYLADQDDRGLDGLIMTMTADDPKWSFAEVAADGLVRRVVEKEVISDEATVGIYNFRRGADFVAAADDMIARDLRVNGEFYVAPTYDRLIAAGGKVGVHNVGSEAAGMYGLGIPADLELFLTLPVLDKAVGAVTKPSRAAA